MKEKQIKKTTIQVTEIGKESNKKHFQIRKYTTKENVKKIILFSLMGVLFIGSIYWIFKPTEDSISDEYIGINNTVPEATNLILPTDKSKAYEYEIMERAEQEKRRTLTTLSDYLNFKEKEDATEISYESYKERTNQENKNSNENSALSNYRNMQNTLDNFYQEDNTEALKLRKQIEDLKIKLAEKDVPPIAIVDDQLKLMEKSYEMAAKYLPQNSQLSPALVSEPKVSNPIIQKTSVKKEQFLTLTSTKKNTVTSLYREPSDSTFINHWNQTRNRTFYGSQSSNSIDQPKNSIRASVQETQTVTGEMMVRLRLLEEAQTKDYIISKGTILTANAKLQNGRLQLKISSVEIDGNIVPVDLTIYDLDGQPGLYVPYSSEMHAVTEMAANMSQSTGTSLVLTQNAGQQVATDLSRGIVQGISNYFSKKVRTPKVTLKAGHQVYLVSKEQ